MKLRTVEKNVVPRLAAILAIAIGVSGSLSSCKKKAAVTQGDPVPPIDNPFKPGGDTGAKAFEAAPISGTTQSQHFASVAQHLDLGGVIFGYLDVDGDVEKIADVAQGFLDMAKEQGGDSMPPHLKTLDLGKVLGKLGFDGVEAIGISSYKDGELYHNKGYMHVPAGRKGLLKIVGGAAGPFVSKSLAPKDADLVIEQTLDVRAGFDVVSAMVADLGGPEASAQFMQAVGEVIPQLGLSMADLFRKLDTRITVIGRIHPDKPIAIPDAPMKVPSFDLLITFDDLGWLYEKVTTEMKKEMPADQQAQMFAMGDGFERIGLPPMPDPETPIAQPVIQHDIANKRILIASTPAFLDECLAGSSNLSENTDFAKATMGLPTEGNGLSYVSARIMDEYRKLVEEMMKAQPGGEAGMAAVSAMMASMLPKAVGSQASVTVNTAEGILMVANSAQSYKESVVAGGVAGVAVAAALAVPALKTAQDRAMEAKDEAMRRQQELQEQIRELENEGAVPDAPDPADQ